MCIKDERKTRQQMERKDKISPESLFTDTLSEYLIHIVTRKIDVIKYALLELEKRGIIKEDIENCDTAQTTLNEQ